MLRHRMDLIIAAMALNVVVNGCKPEVSQLTWEEIDVETAYSEMMYPTGRLEYVSAYQFQNYLGENVTKQLSLALTMAATLEKLAKAAGAETETVSDGGIDPDSGPFDPPKGTDTEKTSSSTNLFLEIGCPGPDGYSTGRDFSNGLIRIDSGDLSDFSLHNFFEGVHLLLSFRNCAIPRVVIDATTPAYLFGGFSGILVDTKALGLEKGNIKAKYVYSRGPNSSLLVNVKNEGTYRLDSIAEGDRVEMVVVTANGRISCHFAVYGNVFNGCTFL